MYCGTVVSSSSQKVSGNQPIKPASRPIIQRRTFLNQPQSIQKLRIMVTSPWYDNIGQILDQLSIKYLPYENDYNCDIFFLNCGTHDAIAYHQLEVFVQNGGILYASDLASSHILEIWPDLMTVRNDTTSCTIRAIIEDSDLLQYLGNSIDVNFDLGSWSRIESVNQGKVIMRSADEGFPIMMEFSIGQGKVFYTSFHNHAQTAEAEKKLLQLLVIKQVASATKQNFRKTVESMPVSF